MLSLMGAALEINDTDSELYKLEQDIAKLQEAFGAEVSGYDIIMKGNNVGLKVVFNTESVGKYGYAIGGNMGELPQNQKDVLINLAEKHELLVLENAHVNLFSTHTVSDSAHVCDPFHRDADINSGVGMISKGAFFSARKAPTYYAMPEDVITAIKKIDKSKWDLYSTEIRSFKAYETDGGYNLSCCAAKLARKFIQKEKPELVQQIFDLIPDDKKFAHYWEPGINTVVLHSNKPPFRSKRSKGSITHARPHVEMQEGQEDTQCLQYTSLNND